jgi:hypothetical protein
MIRKRAIQAGVFTRIRISNISPHIGDARIATREKSGFSEADTRQAPLIAFTLPFRYE